MGQLRLKEIALGFSLSLALVANIYAHGDEKHTQEEKTVQNEKSAHSNKIEASKLEEINQNYMSSIEPIFKQKCYDCHSNKTDYPWYHSIPGIKQMLNSHIQEGKEHIIFSKGFPFPGHGEPLEDLKELREVVEEDSMPIWQYKLMHWNSSLNQKEKEKILDWIENSKKIIEN